MRDCKAPYKYVIYSLSKDEFSQFSRLSYPRLVLLKNVRTIVVWVTRVSMAADVPRLVVTSFSGSTAHAQEASMEASVKFLRTQEVSDRSETNCLRCFWSYSLAVLQTWIEHISILW